MKAEIKEIFDRIKKATIQEPNKDNTELYVYHTMLEEDLIDLESEFKFLQSQLEKEREASQAQNEILTTVYHLLKVFHEKADVKYFVPESLENLNQSDDEKTKS